MCPIWNLPLKNDLMKVRPAVCFPTNQQAKSILAVQMVVHRSSSLVLVTVTQQELMLRSTPKLIQRQPLSNSWKPPW